MKKNTDYYKRLGISEDATPEEIKRAYRRAARRVHPDINIKPGATELFLGIKEAYEVLIDPDIRVEYNRSRETRPQKRFPVRITTQFNLSAIQHSEEKQVFYALLDLSVLPKPGQAQRQTPAINVALVLDISTSMKGARINTVKATAIELVRQLRDQDTFSIIAFNDRAEEIYSSTKGLHLRKAERQIHALRPRGGTEISRGIEAGLKKAQDHLRPSGVNHIFLITDGKTYGDEQACRDLADEAARDGIGLSSFGIGDKWNDELLDDLAARTGGDCVYIHNPHQIQSLLKKKFRSLEQAYAKQIQLNFKTGPAIDLNYALRIRPEIGVLDTKSPLQLGHLPRSHQQRVLMEFIIEPIPTSTETVLVLDGSFNFQIPSESLTTYEVPLTLTRSAQSTPPVNRPSAALQEALSKLTLYRMQEQAQADLEQGNYQRATQRLDYIATHLLSQGEQNLANTVLAEAQHIQKHQRFSPTGRKEIKYGTRALLLSGKEITGELST